MMKNSAGRYFDDVLFIELGSIPSLVTTQKVYNSRATKKAWSAKILANPALKLSVVSSNPYRHFDISFYFHCKNGREKTQEPLRFLGFWGTYLFVPHWWLRGKDLKATSYVSLRAALRCPKNAAGFRIPLLFSTAAEKALPLYPPPAARQRFSQRATLAGLITRN